MKLKIIYYHFDTKLPGQSVEWEELKARLSKTHNIFDAAAGFNSSGYQTLQGSKDAETVTLDQETVFSNQFNTNEGKRLFDWRLYHYFKDYKGIREGYYVEDLTELNKLRSERYKCGYCGKYTDLKTAEKQEMFCESCIGSEYLKKDQLCLLRLAPLTLCNHHREDLTEDEEAWLIPKWEVAQGLGKKSRGKQIASRNRKMVAGLIGKAEVEAAAVITKAEFKTSAYTWLLDHKFSDLGDTIIYDHRDLEELVFGWNEKLSPDARESLEKLLKDAPFKWRITK